MYFSTHLAALFISLFVLIIQCATSEQLSSSLLEAEEEKRAPGWGKRNILSSSEKDFLESKRAPGWGKRSLSALLDDADEWIDDVPQDYSKRAPGWGKRSLESFEADKRAPGWGKRAPGWGKRAPGWGKRAPGWGKRAPGWGKRAPGWGKRAPGLGKRAPGWGKRSSDECSSVENEFNYYISKAVQTQIKLITNCFESEEKINSPLA